MGRPELIDVTCFIVQFLIVSKQKEEKTSELYSNTSPNFNETQIKLWKSLLYYQLAYQVNLFFYILYF